MRMFFHALAVTFATTAHAQIAIDPNPKSFFVCVEKSDAYRLAFADIKGALEDAAKKLDAEGRCRHLPATYLFTIDPYVDMAGVPGRVVELTAYGKRVWGIFGSLPTGVWLISR